MASHNPSPWPPSRQGHLVSLARQAKRLLADGKSYHQIAQQWREPEQPTLLGAPWDAGAVTRLLIYAQNIERGEEALTHDSLHLGG